MDKYALSFTIASLYATFNIAMIRKIFRVDRVKNKCTNMSPVIKTDNDQVNVNPDYSSCVTSKHEKLDTLDKRLFMCDLLLGVIGIVLGIMLKENKETISNGLIGGGSIIILYTLITNRNDITDIYRILTLLFVLSISIYVSY